MNPLRQNLPHRQALAEFRSQHTPGEKLKRAVFHCHSLPYTKPTDRGVWAAFSPDISHLGPNPIRKISVFSDAASEKSDFVAVNPDRVGPTGRTIHTSECDLFGLVYFVGNPSAWFWALPDPFSRMTNFLHRGRDRTVAAGFSIRQAPRQARGRDPSGGSGW